MKKEIWFKAKDYGIGWYPATKKGWLVLLAYLVLFIGGIAYFRYNSTLGNTTTIIKEITYIVIITLILVYICMKKGEPMQWQWGKKR
ncbi:hypothetical protein HZA96_03140 [Candidatus Woesearchaeota archaeon]|nr:hypothetical protein [Candidatus Woesearchaeota archaeon]